MVLARFPDHHTCGARHIEPARMLQMAQSRKDGTRDCVGAAARQWPRRADKWSRDQRARLPLEIKSQAPVRRATRAARRLVAKQQCADRQGLKRGPELNKPHRVRNSPFGYWGSAPSGNWRFASVMSVIVPMRPLNVPTYMSAVENAATQMVLSSSRSRYSMWNTGIDETACLRAASTCARSSGCTLASQPTPISSFSDIPKSSQSAALT